MLKLIMGRAACFTGKHERNGAKIHRVDTSGEYRSACLYCGVPMTRLSKRNWIVTSKRAS